MSFIIVFGIIVAVLFLLSFTTRRRFGMLGLALAGGWLLSSVWTHDATQLVTEVGVKLVAPPLESVVAVALTIAPALLLMRSGPKYHTLWVRIASSALFALMAVSLLLGPLESGLVIDGTGLMVSDFIVQYRTIILTVGLVFAVGDLLFTKTSKLDKSTSKH